jgi:hypothetical protein
MPETKTNPILRLMPSLTDVAFLLPLILLFGGLEGVRNMLGDGDTGWHVRIGDWILAHQRVPRQDMFSFTMPGQPFFAWEWLWDVGAASLHQRWGLGAVVLASLLIISLTIALLYRLVYRRCGNPLVSIALTGLAAAAASIHWFARPHLVTMLMMVVFLSILERVREGRTRLLWSLPLLMIPWANLHGGFLIGIVIVATYGAGELLGAIVTRDSNERRTNLRAAVRYFVAAFACLLAGLVNPYGYRLYTHLIEYFADPYAMKYIQEFQATNFHSPAAMFLEIMLILGLGAAVWYARRRQFTEVLMIAGFGHLSLVVVRNMPIYVIAVAPIIAVPLVAWLKALAEAPIASWITTVFGTFVEIGEELVPFERPWRVHVAPVLVMLLLTVAIAAPSAGIKFKPVYDPKAYPEKALAALTPAGGQLFQPAQRVFTHDEWGDYLIYKLSPRGFKVFVDGRSDFYGGKFGQDYIDVLNVKYTWQQTLDRYGVDTILMPTDAPLAGALKESRRWRVAYDDGMAIVFRPAATVDARMEQVFTGSAGGNGGDRVITSIKQGVPGDHLNHKLEEY